MSVVDMDHALRILEGNTRLAKERNVISFVDYSKWQGEPGPIPPEVYYGAAPAVRRIRTKFNREWCVCRECGGQITEKVTIRQRRCLGCIEAGKSKRKRAA